MKVEFLENGGDFSVSYPCINEKNQLTFQWKGCTHFLLCSSNDCSLFQENTDRITSVVEKMSIESSEPVTEGMLQFRLIQQGCYISNGGYLSVPGNKSHHVIMGCMYDAKTDCLNIHKPQKENDMYCTIRQKVSYAVVSEKTEEKPGFLGIFGKKEAEFKGFYKVKIDAFDNFRENTIFYTVESDEIKYFITKDMLGKYFYVETKKESIKPRIKCIDSTVELVGKSR